MHLGVLCIGTWEIRMRTFKDRITAMKKGGRVEEAAAFAAGYRKAKLQGACLSVIELLKNKSRTEYVSPNEIAAYYGLMGDRDHAFEWLEKAYAERSGRMEYIKVDEALENLTLIPATLVSCTAWDYPNKCRSASGAYDWHVTAGFSDITH